jgi:hypothetical protein
LIKINPVRGVTQEPPMTNQMELNYRLQVFEFQKILDNRGI